MIPTTKLLVLLQTAIENNVFLKCIHMSCIQAHLMRQISILYNNYYIEQ